MVMVMVMGRKSIKNPGGRGNAKVSRKKLPRNDHENKLIGRVYREQGFTCFLGQSIHVKFQRLIAVFY
jgi:hypothetical protein